jgi:phosphoenolpyruvate carboxykinase (ATP)
VNIKQSEEDFSKQKSHAIDCLNTLERLYVVDAFACWDKKYQQKIRVICTSAYHALFMSNMLIKVSEEDLKDFEPDFVVFNAGMFDALNLEKTTTCVSINFKTKESIVLGTEYAGEMKKGVFTILNYLMPKANVLSLHSSCNVGKSGDVCLFFGLSGTGKTTLSADSSRYLLGDDEHCWSDTSVFNIEGGCYAKCVDLKKEQEPEIYGAIKYGSVQENCVFNKETMEVDYEDISITENTRVSYPLEYISNAIVPAITEGHPANFILLTCDSFGVLPPVSKLTIGQTMYHFISGYTAKIPGTEVGIHDPIATFSSCFGAPFMVWHPSKYASLLKDKMEKYNVNAWLINTGWTGGKYGIGSRIKLKFTRAMINAINDGSLEKEEFEIGPFGLQVPKKCNGVPDEILMPKNTWKDQNAYDETLKKVETLFAKNFEQFKDKCDDYVVQSGPHL